MHAPIVFLHIPKTAGTTLHELLCSHFRESEICPERFSDLHRFSTEELSRYRLFSGHFDWSGIDRIPGPKRIVTMLREPRARILSNYYFWCDHTWEHIERHNLVGPRAAKTMGLLDFLRQDGYEFDNYITRALVGRSAFDERGQLRIPEHAALRLALSHLRNMTSVGFFEKADKSLRRIMKHLQLPLPDAIPHKMRKLDLPFIDPQPREQTTPEIERELARLTSIDRQIYARARGPLWAVSRLVGRAA